MLRSRPPGPPGHSPVSRRSCVALALLVGAGLGRGRCALTAAPRPAGGRRGGPALPPPPAVLAKSAYVLDVATGQPLFQKFATQRRPMASTAKLMTGLLAAESGRLEEVATVSKRAAAVGETSMGLVEGEQVAVLDLLYGLMLNSGNDAAIVLAEHLAGSEEAFVERMNARATALGLNDTHFGTVHGLDHAQFRPLTQYSSARDLAVLGADAMANPTLARVAGTTMRDVPGPPGKEPHRLRHTVSAVWWYPGAWGEDRLDGARRAGAGGRRPSWGGTNRRLVAVVMDSPDNVGEIRDLLDYGYARVSKIVPTGADAFPPPGPDAGRGLGALQVPGARPRRGGVRAGPGGGGGDGRRPGGGPAPRRLVPRPGGLRRHLGLDEGVPLPAPGRTPRTPTATPSSPAAGRRRRRAVADWANSTAADQRIGAALLLASRLWNEPAYAAEARPMLDAVLNRAAVSWQNTGVPAPTLGIPAANSFLKELEPVTTSGATLTPAFYRMFAEGTRNAVWLSAAGRGLPLPGRAAGPGAGCPPALPGSPSARTGASARRSIPPGRPASAPNPPPWPAAGPRPALARRPAGAGPARPRRPHPGAGPDPAPADRRRLRAPRRRPPPARRRPATAPWPGSPSPS